MNTSYPTPDGTFIADPERQKKAAAYLSKGRNPQDEETDLISQYVGKDSVYVDVGANIGTIAIPIAKLVKRVDAFEPVKENRDLLEENIKANDVGNITIHPVALGRERGRVSLAPHSDDDAWTYTVKEGDDVELVPLDTVLTSADFIKVDVEGYELEVLQGARELIRTSKPLILFEVSMIQLRKRGDWWLTQVSRELKSSGYFLYVPRQNQPLERVRSVAWTLFKLSPKAFLFGKLAYTISLLAVPSEKTSMIATTKSHSLKSVRP